VLLLFNLLPIWPLDGGRILQSFLRPASVSRAAPCHELHFYFSRGAGLTATFFRLTATFFMHDYWT